MIGSSEQTGHGNGHPDFEALSRDYLLDACGFSPRVSLEAIRNRLFSVSQAKRKHPNTRNQLDMCAHVSSLLRAAYDGWSPQQLLCNMIQCGNHRVRDMAFNLIGGRRDEKKEEEKRLATDKFWDVTDATHSFSIV